MRSPVLLQHGTDLRYECEKCGIHMMLAEGTTASVCRGCGALNLNPVPVLVVASDAAGGGARVVRTHERLA